MGRWIAIGKAPGWDDLTKFTDGLKETSKWRVDPRTTITEVTVLAGQMLYYWNSPATAKHAGEVDKKGKPERKGNGQDSKAASLATRQDVKRPGSSSGRRRG